VTRKMLFFHAPEYVTISAPKADIDPRYLIRPYYLVPEDIAADWAVGGAETIARVRMTDPATYFRVVASILPKDVLVNVQQQTPAGLDADDWSRMISLARTMREIAPDATFKPSSNHCAPH
jgi:hypothetical protein